MAAEGRLDGGTRREGSNRFGGEGLSFNGTEMEEKQKQKGSGKLRTKGKRGNG